MEAPGKIFISYRRTDSETITGRIYEWLTHRVPQEDVFIDIQNIDYGVKFMQRIQETIPQCKAMLVVIGPDWLDSRGSPSTSVHSEIELALSKDLQIIPVLVEGASIPSAEQLPETLRPLVDFNAAPVRSGRDFQRDMEELAEALDLPVSPREGVVGRTGDSPSGGTMVSWNKLLSRMPTLSCPLSRRAMIIGSAGTVALVGLASVGVQRWVSSYPYVPQSVLYLFDKDDGSLYALNVQNGSLRWKFQSQDKSTRLSPVAVGTTVYMEIRTGTLYALDGDKGTVRWQQSFPGARLNYVLVASGTVYVNTGPLQAGSSGVLPVLYALSADNGSLRWQVSSYAAMLVQDDVYGYTSRRQVVNGFIRDDVTGLTVLNAQNGEGRWSYEAIASDSLSTRVSTPVLANRILYLATEISVLSSSETGTLYAIDAQSGTLTWQTRMPGKMVFPLADDDTVYVSSQHGSPAVAALAASDGRPRWEFPITPRIPNQLGTPSPLTVEGGVIFFTADGVYELDARTGAVLWHYQSGVGIEGSQPIIAGDLVYVTSPGYTESTFAVNAYATVYAIARRDSDRPLVWSRKINSGILSTLTVTDRALYFTAGQEGLYAVNRVTGSELWHFSKRNGSFTKPVLSPQA
jgi:outer membrane protein assembly factor BamB